MESPPLTGAQKTRLRGLGQRLEASIKIGRAGYGHDQQVELTRLLCARELVKIRLETGDRHERGALIEKIEQSSGATCVGSVGRTALFFRQNPDVDQRVITL